MAQILYQQPQFINSAAALEAAARARGSIQDAINSVGRGFNAFGDRLANISKQQLEGTKMYMDAHDTLANAVATDRAFEAGEVHKNLADRLAQEADARAAEELKLKQAAEYRNRIDWANGQALLKQLGIFGSGENPTSTPSNLTGITVTDKSKDNSNSTTVSDLIKQNEKNAPEIAKLTTQLSQVRETLAEREALQQQQQGFLAEANKKYKELQGKGRATFTGDIIFDPATKKELEAVKADITKWSTELEQTNDSISRSKTSEKDITDLLGKLSVSPTQMNSIAATRSLNTLERAKLSGDPSEISKALPSAIRIGASSPQVAASVAEVLPVRFEDWSDATQQAAATRVPIQAVLNADKDAKSRGMLDKFIEQSVTGLDNKLTELTNETKKVQADLSKKFFDGKSQLISGIESNRDASAMSVYKKEYGVKTAEANSAYWGEKLQGYFQTTAESIVQDLAKEGVTVTEGQAAYALTQVVGVKGTLTGNDFAAGANRAKNYLRTYQNVTQSSELIALDKQSKLLTEAKTGLMEHGKILRTPSISPVVNNGKLSYNFDTRIMQAKQDSKNAFLKYGLIAAISN